MYVKANYLPAECYQIRIKRMIETYHSGGNGLSVYNATQEDC
jgi:hypothetical protein